MDKFDDKLLSLLQQGKSQLEISEILKEENVKPNSLSSVEKKMNAIKSEYRAKTMFHLACILYNEGHFKVKKEFT